MTTSPGDLMRLELLRKCLLEPACVARNEAKLRDLLAEIEAELALRETEERR